MQACLAIVHASPAIGARFTQYTAEFEPCGELGPTNAQRFIFVLEGELQLEADAKESKIGARGYSYLPEGLAHRVSASNLCRAAVIEKPYRPLDSVDGPAAFISHEDAVASHPLDDDPDLQVKCLLPDTLNFDFAVYTMVYPPGSTLPLVERDLMEHCL